MEVATSLRHCRSFSTAISPSNHSQKFVPPALECECLHRLPTAQSHTTILLVHFDCLGSSPSLFTLNWRSKMQAAMLLESSQVNWSLYNARNYSCTSPSKCFFKCSMTAKEKLTMIRPPQWINKLPSNSEHKQPHPHFLLQLHTGHAFILFRFVPNAFWESSSNWVAKSSYLPSYVAQSLLSHLLLMHNLLGTASKTPQIAAEYGKSPIVIFW